MADDFIVTDLRPDMEGIRQVLHSAGVASMCLEAAEEAAARCNAMLKPKYKKHGAEFAARLVFRTFTAGGLVYCAGAENGKLAGRANLKQNILKKGCRV